MLADMMVVIHDCQNLDWLMLTKRPGNWRARMEIARLEIKRRVATLPLGQEFIDVAEWLGRWLDGEPPQNVWVGTSVGTQKGRTRILQLLKIPAIVRFLSCEPLLERIEIRNIPPINPNAPCTTNCLTGETAWPDYDRDEGPRIHWVIAGGESGAGARPMHPGWVYDLWNQCKIDKVPFHFKQWGEWAPAAKVGDTVSIKTRIPGCPENPQWHIFPDGQHMGRIGKKYAGHEIDGVAVQDFPA